MSLKKLLIPTTSTSANQDLNEGAKWSHLRYLDPTQALISGIDTYKKTGNLGKSILDPSGDNPFGVMEHKGNKKYQAAEKAQGLVDRDAAREKAKRRKARGMKAGGKTKSGTSKRACCRGMGAATSGGGYKSK